MLGAGFTVLIITTITPVLLFSSVYGTGRCSCTVLCLLVIEVLLPRLMFFRAFSSVVRQMPGYNSQRWGTARTSQIS
jgi:hypothetical protein